MKIIEQEHAVVSVDRLVPHPQNPRRGDVGVIGESIGANGFYGTVLAQKSTGHVLAGNHRLQAAIAAGAETIPVTWADVDDETALRILLADNRTNDLAAYDDAQLRDVLLGLAALEGTGFDDEALNEVLGRLVEEDPSEPPAGSYAEQYGVIVICADEPSQEETYNRLVALGLECRVVTT